MIINITIRIDVMKKIFIYQAIDSKGGSKQSLFNFIKLISNEVKFVCVSGVDGWFYKDVNKYSESIYLIKESEKLHKPIKVKNRALRQLLTMIRMMIFGWKNTKANYNVMKKEKVDIVILNENRDLFFIGIPAIILRKKIYSFIRGEVKKTDLIRMIFSDKVISLSEHLISKQSSLFRSKISVVPNYIDVKKEAISKVIKYDAPLKISFAGSLIPVKGVDHLINIIYLLKRRNIEVNIYGDFPEHYYNEYKRTVYKSIEKKGIEGILKFHGWVDNLQQELQKNDILILTSNSEGLPRVILEAMSKGKPVISFDVGGVRDLVLDNINGYVVPHGNYNVFAKKISTFLENRELIEEFGNESIKIVENNFSQEVVKNKILNLID